MSIYQIFPSVAVVSICKTSQVQSSASPTNSATSGSKRLRDDIGPEPGTVNYGTQHNILLISLGQGFKEYCSGILIVTLLFLVARVTPLTDDVQASQDLQAP